MLAAVATRAERWLLEPPPSHPRATEPEICRPALAVIGLAPRCGTTTLARALAVELAKRDPGGAAIVTSSTRPPAGALASTAARRLARSLTASAPAALGRLCAVDADDRSLPDLAASRPAPLVLEVAHGAAPELAVALADTAALVAGPAVEPALADLVAASLTRDDRPPLIVLNRVPEPADWGARHALVVGDVRLGARFALAGREPTPSLAAPIAELADLLVPGEPG
jgi:hypothetical protein